MKCTNKHFKFKPPTRICVGQSCDSDFNIMMELSGTRSFEKVKHLHVQSVSYWAPANIGPYSQACQVDGWIYYAGQIGLSPELMTLVSKCSVKQLNQSLENFDKVIERMRSSPEAVIR